MNESVRLSKRLTERYVCSRREAELLIEGGWVTVNGAVVEEPQFKVGDEEEVLLLPDARAKAVEPATLLLHWPADTALDATNPVTALPVTAETRFAEDRSGIRLLRKHLQRLTTMLPMETGMAGLTVLTQDWHVTRKLTEDAALVEQEIIVEVSGSLAPDGLALLNHGLSFQDRALAPAKVSWQNENRLRFAIKHPRPGQITHMCESVGLSVKSMKRIRIGRISMAGLPVMQWRYLSRHERF